MTTGAGGSRTTAEWWTFAVALGLIALVVGVIVVGWATGATGPPVLEARATGAPEMRGTYYRVPFEVRNTGAEAATDVQVVAELRIDGALAGEGEQSVMFLSGGERESGAFLFADDPSTGELTISVASYLDP